MRSSSLFVHGPTLIQQQSASVEVARLDRRAQDLLQAALDPKSRQCYQKVYKEVIQEIKSRLNDTAKTQVTDIQGQYRSKYNNFTSQGKERKERIIERLFFEQQKTNLILNLYVSVLPTLKNYTTFFPIEGTCHTPAAPKTAGAFPGVLQLVPEARSAARRSYAYQCL